VALAGPGRTARGLAAAEGRARLSNARGGRALSRAVDRYPVAE
jgi:hypothetical protein